MEFDILSYDYAVKPPVKVCYLDLFILMLHFLKKQRRKNELATSFLLLHQKKTCYHGNPRLFNHI